MTEPLSASDAVTPAIELTKKRLFQPFRFGVWLRMALLGLLTGEAFGSGGCSGSGGDWPNWPEESDGGSDALLALAGPSWEAIRPYAAWIVLGVLAAIALSFVWLYIGSVFRFVLFDAVVADRYRLREGWRRWQEQGIRFFIWQVVYGLASSAIFLIIVGLPVLFAWSAGIFRNPKEHLALLILGGLGLFVVLLVLVFVSAAIGIFAKDFLVPVMALENLGIMDAWRRVLPLMDAEKVPYVIYLLLKIVLAIGAVIIFGIIDLILLFGFIIVVGIIVAAVLLSGGTGMVWDAVSIFFAAVAGVTALTAFFFLLAMVYAPGLVFFQSYALIFLGSRYPQLDALLNPEPPAPPAPSGSPSSPLSPIKPLPST